MPRPQILPLPRSARGWGLSLVLAILCLVALMTLPVLIGRIQVVIWTADPARSPAARYLPEDAVPETFAHAGRARAAPMGPLWRFEAGMEVAGLPGVLRRLDGGSRTEVSPPGGGGAAALHCIAVGQGGWPLAGPGVRACYPADVACVWPDVADCDGPVAIQRSTFRGQALVFIDALSWHDGRLVWDHQAF